VDVRQIPEALAVIEPVPHNERIGGREPDVARLDLDQPPVGAVEQRAHLDGFGAAEPQRREQVVEREAGVDDVLDDQHVRAAHRPVDVLQQPDAAARPGGGAAVGRDRDEVQPLGDRQPPRQVGQEDR